MTYEFVSVVPKVFTKLFMGFSMHVFKK